MRRHLFPLAVTLSLSVAAAAFAQSGGAGGGGGGASGGGTGGGAGGASSGASGGTTAPAGTGSTGPAGTTGSASVGASGTPPGAVSPLTEDVAGGSRVPRARSGTELGVPQPRDAAADTGIGSPNSSVSPSTVDRQNERDRALDRSLIQGGGICDGCGPGVSRPSAR
jgi:hypothetical protein